MKVLLIAQHANSCDGWGTLTRTTAQGLQSMGHEVELLLQKTSDDLSVHQIKGLPPPLALLGNPLAILYAAWKIAKHSRNSRPDIIHILVEPYALAMPFVRSRYRHPWVLTGCGTYTIFPFLQKITGGLLRRVYEDVDHVLAISSYTEKRILDELQQRLPSIADRVAQKMSVYTLGIEQPETLPQKQQHTMKKIVFVGGVKERKGVREIIEACGKLKESALDSFHLDIIGSFPVNIYTKQLQKRVAELSLESNVTFRGHISEEELLQAYADADVFLMLSIAHEMHFEGFGLVFLEANSFGVPVIGPNDSGCIDAIAHGKSGFSVDPKNPEIVADAMRKIFEDNAIHSSECITWAKEHSVTRQTEEMLSIYNKVVL